VTVKGVYRPLFVLYAGTSSTLAGAVFQRSVSLGSQCGPRRCRCARPVARGCCLRGLTCRLAATGTMARRRSEPPV